MKKTEKTAVKAEDTAKAGTVVMLNTVLKPEAKPGPAKAENPAPKPDVKAEAPKAEKSAPKPEAKAGPPKAEKSASKSEAKSELPKAEKSTAKPEAKPGPAKAENPASKSEAKSEAVIAEKSASKPEAKPEPAKGENPASKHEAKSEAITAEKSASKPEAKAGPAKAKSAAPKPKARLKATKAENPSSVPEGKAEPPVQAAKPEPNAGEQVVPPPVSGKAPSVPNPPAVSERPAVQVVDSPLKRMKQEFTERTNVIKQEMRNIQNSFLVIGFQLHWIKTNNMYKVLNYKNIMDYAEKEFGIKKSTCCNFINIIENYAERDGNGEVIESIAECYRNFTSSQLIAMIGMPEEVQQQVTPDMSVRSILNMKKSEPEQPPVDAPKAVISDAEPVTPPTPAHEAPKSASSAPVHEAPKPTAPVHELPKSTVSVPVHEVPKSTVSVPVHEAPKPAGPASNPAANNSGKPMGNHRDPAPRTLLEIESYSGYRSMVDKIDKLVKDAFSAGKQMRVKIVCEEE